MVVQARLSLRAREKEIAEEFIGGFPWVMAIWTIANTSIWLALWPLVLTETVPLWLGFLAALITAGLAYLPSHEAQHYIFFAKNSPHRWVNEALG